MSALKKYVFIFFFSIVCVLYCSNREKRIDWDVFGYYLYLPAEFIYHDIRLEKKEQWLNPIIAKYNTTDNLYQAYKGPQDAYVMKYTMGLSYVYAPFFFIANAIAPMLGYEQDGFSPPYQWMLFAGALLFSIIGIFYLFRILSIYYSDHIVLTTIAFIVFGSNYFVMTAYDGLMPHNFVFTFFAIMLYYSIKWYENQKIKYAFIIGFCIGASVLIRPTSAIVTIIPALWSVGSFIDLKKRITLLRENFFQLSILAFVTFLVILPQFLYWKSVTGQWLFYSYPDEKINLFTPHIINIFFSYKKGWLLYTPIMIFAILGFVNLYKKNYSLFFSIFLFFLINSYLISCWDCWWYGGSFAQRPFVESYIFMAFPLAAFVETLINKKLLIVIPIFLIGVFFLYLNLFQTKQALNGVLHTSLTTKEYYWKVFMKNTVTDEDKRWLEPSQYADGKDETNPNFEYSCVYGTALVLDDNSANLNPNNLFSKSILTPDMGYDVSDHYVSSEISVDTNTTNTSPELIAHLVTCINKNGKLYKYRSHDFTFDAIKKNIGKAQLTVLVPPQVNDINFQIKSYVYINETSKMKLLSLTTKVLIHK